MSQIHFKNFANVWSAVTLSKRVKEKPLAIRFAGENILLYRKKNGSVAALLDRCPHRGVKLSLGYVKDDCIVCPFHEWKFNSNGECTHIPLNPDAKKDLIRAYRLPVRDRGGVIWVYTQIGPDPANEPEIPDAIVNSKLAQTYLTKDWNCHWTRAMENMLDSPHVPFVHRTTIGRPMQKYLKPDSKMDITWEEAPFGGRTKMILDGDERNLAWLEFHKPNMMVLFIPMPGQIFRMHSICIPIDEFHTRMMIIGSRSFASVPGFNWLLNPLFNATNAYIAYQDQAVVESSQPIEVPLGRDEKSVRTDRATLKFRGYYYDELKSK
jgi:phenylpropionate dioxygenase-like ring-hydroxylating dioxygenase large terminal subunit